MKHRFFPMLAILCLLTAVRADQTMNQKSELSAGALPNDDGCVIMPDPTNAIQLRLYTNAVPRASHLFNTFEIEAYGQTMLRSPGKDSVKRALAKPSSNTCLHSILVNGTGPDLSASTTMRVIARASGPEWSYVALDASSAYRSRLERYERGILFIQPDLFVLYDHLVAKEPVRFQMVLHPPAVTRLDTNWGDLHLDMPNAGMTIHSPGRRHDRRVWERIDSAADALLPGTVTMQLGPTNKLAQLHVLTVFALRHGGEKKSYMFKLVESASSIGAQVHRDGLPTLIAFKTDSAAESASLAGFGFDGPVGVYVYKPKHRAH